MAFHDKHNESQLFWTKEKSEEAGTPFVSKKSQ